MSTTGNPWIRSRGIGRLLAHETNISDIIQLLSDRDCTPWNRLVGFVPTDLQREVKNANNADLLLTSPERTAIIEVKLGHLMDRAQQKKYEDLASSPTLFLAALRSDEVRLELDSDMWTFLSLSDIISSWEASDLSCTGCSDFGCRASITPGDRGVGLECW